GAALVEELREGGVGADGDDHGGALLVGQQHRDVLAGAGGGEGDRAVLDPQRGEPLHPRGAAIAIGVHHQLGAAAQRAVGDGIHVADDHVGVEARLEHGIGAAVDADDDRAVLAQERLEGGEVLLVVVAAHDDEHRAAVHAGGHVRGADAVQQQVPFAQHVLHGVLREQLELFGQALARDLEGGGHRRVVLPGAGGDGPVLEEHLVPGDRELLAVADLLEDGGAQAVDQHDAGVHEDPRTGVGVPAGGGGGDVEHRGRLPLHEGLGGDPVDVLVVDHGDVAGLEALGEVLGALAEARGAREGGAHRSAPRPALCAAARPVPCSAVTARASSSSSSAWARATSEASSPASIRASSRIRSGRSRVSTVELVVPSWEDFTICRWVLAWAATCGRWVTTITWAWRASRARRCPTASAARPPIPASISSKTNTGAAVRSLREEDSATSRASITRESSPPEAAWATGRCCAPGCGASRIATASRP